jgi:hypothetical protein
MRMRKNWENLGISLTSKHFCWPRFRKENSVFCDTLTWTWPLESRGKVPESFCYFSMLDYVAATLLECNRVVCEWCNLVWTLRNTKEAMHRCTRIRAYFFCGFFILPAQGCVNFRFWFEKFTFCL